jgi:protein phosphatase
MVAPMSFPSLLETPGRHFAELARQYAPVAASSHAGLAAATDALAHAAKRGLDVAGLRDRFTDRVRRAELYGKA